MQSVWSVFRQPVLPKQWHKSLKVSDCPGSGVDEIVLCTEAHEFPKSLKPPQNAEMNAKHIITTSH